MTSRLHPQLEILLQLQDLRAQRRELVETEPARRFEEEEFHIDVEEAVRLLDEKIAELREELEPAVRRRYDRIGVGHPRVVVPVVHGTCYGCFMRLPTEVATQSERNAKVSTCMNCGRFLYWVN